MKTRIVIIIFLFFSIGTWAQEQPRILVEYSSFNPLDYPQGIQSIKIYSATGCYRCIEVKETLEKYGLEFTVISSEDTLLFAEMDNRVYKSVPDHSQGYSIHFPVIALNSDFYFCINDFQGFMHDLKRFFGKVSTPENN